MSFGFNHRMTRDVIHALIAGTAIAAVLLCITLFPGHASSFEGLDVVSGVLESPNFKEKKPIEKLRSASELLRTQKLKPQDMTLVLLDWGERYLMEPTQPIARLQRWAELGNDEQLSRLRIPREFLNRILVVEYLLEKTPYLQSTPKQRLELLRQLEEQHLLDPSVYLTYTRLYAGGFVVGAKTFALVAPLDELKNLKALQEQKLIGQQYRVSVEAVLALEVVTMDPKYRNGSPGERLNILRTLESEGLINTLTKKELERLPAWRLVSDDSTFLKADRVAKRKHLTSLKQDGLISDAVYMDLMTVFRLLPVTQPSEESRPPVPIESK